MWVLLVAILALVVPVLVLVSRHVLITLPARLIARSRDRRARTNGHQLLD
jgi:hypothetical protein